jgi:hypothetical protein
MSEDPVIGENINIIQIEYAARRLNICGVCRLIYNVGDRIPRILVNCGHTYCTSCINRYYRNERIRCPCCRKLVKHLESVESLPLNISIFSEIVETDPMLLLLLDSNSSMSMEIECCKHPEKSNHFYCSYHETNFCRDCIKKYHKDDNCCVVDLYDINKLYQLNEQNSYKNQLIVKAREKQVKTKDEFFIANA